MFVETERHENCTVIVCEDSETGEVSISWWDNKKPPALIITDLNEESGDVND